MEKIIREYIEKYEKNRKKNREEITDEMIRFLYTNINESEKLKKIYREVLIEQNKYNNNYYSKVCIIINNLKYNKIHKENVQLTHDAYNITLPLLGELKVYLEGKGYIIKTVEKSAEYKRISSINECVGEKNTINKKKKIIEAGKDILKSEKMDIKQGIEWKESYKNYVIRTYGRWSSQYEDYMTTLFDPGFLPVSPNLILAITREHLKKAIKEKLEILENN